MDGEGNGWFSRGACRLVHGSCASFTRAHPLFPEAKVDASPGTAFVAGGFAALPLHRWFDVQGELLFSRRRHSVDLQPYEAIQIPFTRDYVEASGLARLKFPSSDRNHFYLAAGPVFGFRVGEHAASSDANLRRGDPNTDIYAIQVLVYAAPELLRKSQTSVTVAGGWVYRRLLVEVRFTRGVQSIFRDREGLVSGFAAVGGDESTLRRLIAQFGPFLESAKSRDVALLAGVRF